MAGWLDDEFVAGVVGMDIWADVDTAVAGHAVDAVRSWVEDRRPDVTFETTDEATDEVTVTAPPHLRVAAALLAYRCYRSREFPEKELGQAPELAAMLGIGKSRRFSVGGAVGVATA